MRSDNPQEMVATLANKLGLLVSVSQDRESWSELFSEACKWGEPDAVRALVGKRVGNITALVINDTQNEDLDFILEGLAMAIEDGVVRWGDFSAAMAHHGKQDGLAEMEARLLQKLPGAAHTGKALRQRL